MPRALSLEKDHRSALDPNRQADPNDAVGGEKPVRRCFCNQPTYSGLGLFLSWTCKPPRYPVTRLSLQRLHRNQYWRPSRPRIRSQCRCTKHSRLRHPSRVPRLLHMYRDFASTGSIHWSHWRRTEEKRRSYAKGTPGMN